MGSRIKCVCKECYAAEKEEKRYGEIYDQTKEAMECESCEKKEILIITTEPLRNAKFNFTRPSEKAQFIN